MRADISDLTGYCGIYEEDAHEDLGGTRTVC